MLFSRVSPNKPANQDCHGDKERQTDREDSPCDTEREIPLIQAESQSDTQVSGCLACIHTYDIHNWEFL